MESDDQFLTKAAEVVEKAQNNYATNKQVLEGDRERLKRIYNNFSSACDYLIQEMKEGVESIQDVLHLAVQDDDSSKSCNLLENLDVFFNKPTTFSTLEANHKMFIKAQEVTISKNIFRIKKKLLYLISSLFFFIIIIGPWISLEGKAWWRFSYQKDVVGLSFGCGICP